MYTLAISYLTENLYMRVLKVLHVQDLSQEAYQGGLATLMVYRMESFEF